MHTQKERSQTDSDIQRLTVLLDQKDREIAKLRKELAEAQAQLPWISEACGDDLWE